MKTAMAFLLSVLIIFAGSPTGFCEEHAEPALDVEAFFQSFNELWTLNDRFAFTVFLEPVQFPESDVMLYAYGMLGGTFAIAVGVKDANIPLLEILVSFKDQSVVDRDDFAEYLHSSIVVSMSALYHDIAPDNNQFFEEACEHVLRIMIEAKAAEESDYTANEFVYPFFYYADWDPVTQICTVMLSPFVWKGK